MQRVYTKFDEMVEDLQQHVDNVTPEDQILVAVFTKEGDKVRIHRMTWNFPDSEKDNVVNLLRQDLRKVLPTIEEPLPEAQIEFSPEDV